MVQVGFQMWGINLFNSPSIQWCLQLNMNTVAFNLVDIIIMQDNAVNFKVYQVEMEDGHPCQEGDVPDTIEAVRDFIRYDNKLYAAGEFSKNW